MVFFLIFNFCSYSEDSRSPGIPGFRHSGIPAFRVFQITEPRGLLKKKRCELYNLSYVLILHISSFIPYLVLFRFADVCIITLFLVTLYSIL